MAMYGPNKTIDDSQDLYRYDKYYEPWKESINWTGNYSECLLCKLTFYNVDHFGQVKTPDGDLIGYICPTCSDKYEIVIKKKTSDLDEQGT